MNYLSLETCEMAAIKTKSVFCFVFCIKFNSPSYAQNQLEIHL